MLISCPRACSSDVMRVTGCAYHAPACVLLGRDARERAGQRALSSDVMRVSEQVFRGGRHSDMRVGKYPVHCSRL